MMISNIDKRNISDTGKFALIDFYILCCYKHLFVIWFMFKNKMLRGKKSLRTSSILRLIMH